MLNPIRWFLELRRDALEARQLRAVRAHYARARLPLLSLKLRSYSYGDCCLAVADACWDPVGCAPGPLAWLPHEERGQLAWLLYCRCGRGKTSLEDAVILAISRCPTNV